MASFSLYSRLLKPTETSRSAGEVKLPAWEAVASTSFK